MAKGKWDDGTFPEVGWTYKAPKDLGEYGASICEICEGEKIRYAHLVTHPKFPEGFWAGCECAERLCPQRAAAIRATEGKMRFEAEQERRRSVTVEGAHFLTAPPEALLPKFSPLLKAGWYARFSLLPFPKPSRVQFTANGWTWVLDGGGENTCWLFPVAAYPTDPGTGEAWGGWPTCQFGAVLLRKEDCDAIKKLTNDKPSSYTIRWHKRCKPTGCVIWSEAGAATWRHSETFLRSRAQQFTNPDGRWDLSKVLLTPEQEEETSIDLTGIEQWT
jgi:hypothetical protein